MRSSSLLFPVSLISAEMQGNLNEDTYLLNPNRSPDSSVRLAVTRINLRTVDAAPKPPIVLLHGSFSNRLLWISADGKGLAAHLAERGFDVWIPEMRGHGMSPVNKEFLSNSSEDYWRDDLPAINAFIIEQSHQVPIWIAKGWASLHIAAALAMSTIPMEHIRGLVMLEPRISYPPKYKKLPGMGGLASWVVKRRAGLVSSLQQGPEAEPVSIIQEGLGWTKRGGLWNMQEGSELWERVAVLDKPLLMLHDKHCSSRIARESERLFEHWGCDNKERLLIDIPKLNQVATQMPSELTVKGVDVGFWSSIDSWIQRLFKPLAPTVHTGSRRDGLVKA